MLHRRGFGKVRHLAIKELWLQEEVKQKRLKITYVSTDLNVSDMFTKSLPKPRFEALRDRLGVVPDSSADVVAMVLPTMITVYQVALAILGR